MLYDYGVLIYWGSFLLLSPTLEACEEKGNDDAYLTSLYAKLLYHRENLRPSSYLQPVLRLELVPAFVEGAEHQTGDQTYLGVRVLGQLRQLVLRIESMLHMVLTLSGCVLAMAFMYAILTLFAWTSS